MEKNEFSDVKKMSAANDTSNIKKFQAIAAIIKSNEDDGASLLIEFLRESLDLRCPVMQLVLEVFQTIHLGRRTVAEEISKAKAFLSKETTLEFSNSEEKSGNGPTVADTEVLYALFSHNSEEAVGIARIHVYTVRLERLLAVMISSLESGYFIPLEFDENVDNPKKRKAIKRQLHERIRFMFKLAFAHDWDMPMDTLTSKILDDTYAKIEYFVDDDTYKFGDLFEDIIDNFIKLYM
jgi:hypothetical protein